MKQPPPTTLDTDCLVPSAWYRLEAGGPVAATGRNVLAHAARQDVVLLGEYHTSRDDHLWQLQTLAALHLLQPDMVIGFEAFPRQVQPVLDAWVAGELDSEQFLQQVAWEKIWNYPPELYLPLFEFARLNRIPLLALNVERGLVQAVRRHGWSAVPETAKEGVSRPASPATAYVDTLFDVFQQHVDDAHAHRDAADFRHFVQAQTTWDRAMAQALAERLRASAGKPLLVGIMGAGHVRNGHGVPHQLQNLGVTRVMTLLPLAAAQACEPLPAHYADAVFVLPAHAD